jgi:hypothetical protein
LDQVEKFEILLEKRNIRSDSVKMLEKELLKILHKSNKKKLEKFPPLTCKSIYNDYLLSQ